MIRNFKSIVFFLLMIVACKSQAMRFTVNDSLNKARLSDTASFRIFVNGNDVQQIIIIKPDEQKRKKLISAMLAFPFPFGFMGAHRVMLGCKPWVPVVYVATFGGCFGLLPMIDFLSIICSKDISVYENNPHVFMWLK